MLDRHQEEITIDKLEKIIKAIETSQNNKHKTVDAKYKELSKEEIIQYFNDT